MFLTTISDRSKGTELKWVKMSPFVASEPEIFSSDTLLTTRTSSGSREGSTDLSFVSEKSEFEFPEGIAGFS